MPRYHFNVTDGISIPDKEGTELPDLSTARMEAVRLAGALLKDAPKQFWNNGEWHLEVTDDDGQMLFTLSFTASNAAVAHED